MASIELVPFDNDHSINHHESVLKTPERSEHPLDIFDEVVGSAEAMLNSLAVREMRYCCFYSSKRAYFGTALFIIISMVVGILTVCLTSPKPKDICQFTYKRTITNIKDYNSLPQSVAIGYFNNDTQLDFVIANTGIDTIDIFLGYNNGTFENHATYLTDNSSRPYSVAVGNFDNISGIDIAVANFGTNSINIFFGFNNGDFTFGRSFSTGSSHPLLIAVADLNNDRRLDIVVLNYGTNSIGLFLGFGDGTFALSMTYSTGYDSLPNSLAIGHLNNDNQLDIVVANFGTNNIGLFFGHGNGTFQDQNIYYTGFRSNPSSVVITDINNDDHLDIIDANYGTNNIGIFFGYGNGSFAKQVTYSTGVSTYPQFIAVGDFNKDNQLDIIVTDPNNEKVYILPGERNGTFPSLSVYPTDFGSSPFSLVVDDFNHDNGSDALIINRGANNILTLMGYNATLTLSYMTFTTDSFSEPVSIAVGDINGDNILDVIVANDDDDKMSVFFGYGNGSFSFLTTLSTERDSDALSIVLVDLNEDNYLDIAVVLPESGSLGILLGHGDGMFSTITTYSTGDVTSPFSLSVGHINHDNYLDIVTISNASDTIGIFFGYCNGTFVMVQTFRTLSGWGPWSIVIDDFNSDNQSDLIIVYNTNGALSIFFGDGNGRFPTNTTYSFGDLLQLSSMTLGDFNNDNRRDIAVISMLTNEILIFFGDGYGNLTDINVYSIKSCLFPTSVVAGDFNSDYQPDIAVTCYSSFNIVIVFGNNNGDFSTQKSYSTGDQSFPVSIAYGDFNNDNQLDIAVTNYGRNSVGIFMSYYYADFVVQTKYFTGSGPHPYSVASGDFNNDSLLDIVVANSATENVGIRLGFGNGSFGIERTYSTGQNSFPRYVNVGDFNRDHRLDIVIANSQGDSIGVFFGYGNGTFGRYVTYSMNLQSSPTSIAINDLNNDEWLDLVVTNEGTNDLGILYGYNYATFHLQQTYSTGIISTPIGVSVGNLNNDSRLDIVVANRDSNNVCIFIGYGNGTFGKRIIYSTGNGSTPFAIALADFNNDSCLDIVVANIGTESIGILLGYGNGTFRTLRTYPAGSDSESLAIVVGDVNNDSQLDVIVTDTSTDSVGIFLGFGNGSFSAIIKYSTGYNSNPNSAVLGDLNDDKYLDIVVANTDTDSVAILLGYGNGSFAVIMTYPLEKESSPFSVALGDFNNDHQLDIAVANFGFDNVGIFLGFGNGSFSTQKIYSIGSGSSPAYITVGYFNSDNQLDIAVICGTKSAFTILFETEDGEFLVGRQYTTSSTSGIISIAYGDFNNDTRLDFVVANMLVNSMDIFLGNGNESFATAITMSTGLDSKPHSIAVGDFNNDNRLDFVIANYGTDNIGIILGDETEVFSNLITYSTGSGSRPYAVVADDFNDDHQLDIAVANSGTDDVTIFHGYGNGSFIAIETYSTGTGSLPYAIVVRDFNNDQQMDIAVANSGANTILILFGFENGTFGNKTSYSIGYNSRPYSLAVGDFNDDSWLDIAVANYGADYVEILLKTC